MRIRVDSPASGALPEGVRRITYRSEVDGLEDWALFWPVANPRVCVVHLHGHGSSGDQVFTRPDFRDCWLSHYRRRGLAVFGPNLRGNAWMSPEAAADLRALLLQLRNQFPVGRLYFLSGSMGGTANLIYATLFPEDVAAVAALCPASDIEAYHRWCAANPGGVVDEIRAAIEQAYGGTPSEAPERYASHRAILRADRLKMPLLLAHSTADSTIPVEQSRALAQELCGSPHFTYREIPSGAHDAPLQQAGLLDWLDGVLDSPEPG